jgi:NAD(P)-dependent dehydrogenase (short-subunit alcohol dehydrogenase family)
MAAYVASKHGLNGLVKSWALELGSKGICVNSVCRGWVKTESNLKDIRRWAQKREVSEDTVFNELVTNLGLGRFIEEIEVANLVKFLISEESFGINGQIYPIR